MYVCLSVGLSVCLSIVVIGVVFAIVVDLVVVVVFVVIVVVAGVIFVVFVDVVFVVVVFVAVVVVIVVVVAAVVVVEVCSDSVVVTAYDFASGRSSSNPEWEPIYYKASITAQGLHEPSSLRDSTMGTRAAKHKGCNWTDLSTPVRQFFCVVIDEQASQKNLLLMFRAGISSLFNVHSLYWLS